MEKYTALDLLFETGLRHLYQAEKAIAENLIKMEKNADSSQLGNIFKGHYIETERQIERLEEVFKILDIDVSSSKLQGLPTIADQAKELLATLADINFNNHSKGLNGILGEGKELLRHFAKTEANPFALVSAGQKVEHFEIACYSSVILLANRYTNTEVINLLGESLDEEVKMEKRLSRFAKNQLDALVGSSS